MLNFDITQGNALIQSTKITQSEFQDGHSDWFPNRWADRRELILAELFHVLPFDLVALKTGTCQADQNQKNLPACFHQECIFDSCFEFCHLIKRADPYFSFLETRILVV